MAIKHVLMLMISREFIYLTQDDANFLSHHDVELYSIEVILIARKHIKIAT